MACARLAASLFGSALLCIALLVQRIDGQTQQGFATFYGGPQDNTSPSVPSFGLVYGSCGYGTLLQADWPYWQATAIGPSNPLYTGGNKRGCGTCIRATCTDGCMANASALVVEVTDTCDTCAPTQINVHSSAFARYFNSDLVVGRVSVSWQQVDCAPPGDIKVKVTDFRPADGRFIALALTQVAGSGVISAIDIQSAGQSNWQPMYNDHGAVWQASNLGTAPYSLRITGGSQNQLIAQGAITALANGTYSTGVQFGGVAATSPPASAPPPPVPASTAQPTVPGTGVVPIVVPQNPPAAVPPTAAAATPPTAPAAVPLTAAQPPGVSASPTLSEATPPPVTAPVQGDVAPAAIAPAPLLMAASESTVAGPTVAPAPAPLEPEIVTAATPDGLQTSAPTPAPTEESEGLTAASVPVAAPAPSPASDVIVAAPEETTPGPAPAANAPVPTTAEEALTPQPAAAPGTTSLQLNSTLEGAAARAANTIINPAISVSAGRRLQRALRL